MKILFCILAAIFVAAGPVLADKTQDAMKYSNYLIEEQNKVAEKFIALTQSFNQKEIKLIELSLDSLKKQVGLSQMKTGKMKGFEGNTRFLEAMKELFKFYDGLCNKEFKALLKIYRKNSITLTEEEIGIIDSIQKSIEIREMPLVNEIDLAQKEFARKYKFFIGKNRLEGQLDSLDKSNKLINAAIDYNDSIIALQSDFTRSLIAFSDNLQKNNNTDEVELYFNKMKEILKTCISSMDNIRDFKGDYSYRNTTMEYFTSFKKLIDGDFTIFLDLVKKKAGYSEEETKQYNKLVYSLPASIDEYENRFIAGQKAFADKYNIFLYKKFKD